jgi:hypothetical protein
MFQKHSSGCEDTCPGRKAKCLGDLFKRDRRKPLEVS